MLEKNNYLTSISLTSNLLTSILFYLSILIFIIAFNFSDTPTPNSWYQQWMPNLNGRQITDITFLDSLTGYAITNNLSPGDTGYILKTSNGGDNWNFSFTVNRGFTAIEFVNLNTGYACGGSGGGTTYLCKTTNAGINWSLVGSPSAAKWKDMSVQNNDTLWLVDDDGLTGGVFRTINGGVNWTKQINLGSSNPEHIYMFNGRIGFICETNNYIRKTTNSGLNWDTILNGESFRDMYFIDSLSGWRAYGNNMYKTTNGGNNWQTQVLPFGGTILSTGVYKFSNINNDTIWGVGGEIFIPPNQSRGIIYKTINGGNSWGFQLPDTAIHIPLYYHNTFVNRLNGWAYFTYTGVHTVTGGDTITYSFIKQISNEVPKEYKLYQNYPNPFNPVTSFKFQVSSLSNVKIIVYDILGREITILVNEQRKSGTYEIEFDGTNYTSGVYFYSMYADGKLVDTKRMILIK